MLATIDIAETYDLISKVKPDALDHWKDAVEAWPSTQSAQEENVIDAHATDHGGELTVDLKLGPNGVIGCDLEKLVKFVCYDWNPKAP
jgi:hypothetical protein